MRRAAGAGDDHLEARRLRPLGESIEPLGRAMRGNDARRHKPMPSASSVSAACFMVCQSDWLPMIMATDFASGRANKIPCAKEASDYTVPPKRGKEMYRLRLTSRGWT